MKNAHGLATGVTGSGKSTFVRHMLKQLPRWVALDPGGDYVDTSDRHTEDIQQLATWLIAHGGDDRFRVSFVVDDEDLAGAMLSMVFGLMDRGAPPLLEVIDEAHLWSQPSRIMPPLGKTIRSGRKLGLHCLSITPRDVQIHRDLRVLTALRIAFQQQGGYSDDFKGAWFSTQLETIANLAALDWPKEKIPRLGRHFVTDPGAIDPVRFYQLALCSRGRPAVPARRPEIPGQIEHLDDSERELADPAPLEQP